MLESLRVVRVTDLWTCLCHIEAWKREKERENGGDGEDSREVAVVVIDCM